MSGRLPSSAVEVVPSRAVAVLLSPVQATCLLLADLMTVASLRRRWWLRDRGDTYWWVACLVVSRPRPYRLLCYELSGVVDRVFRGNTCRLDRHRRVAASRWHLSFLMGVVATLRPLRSVSGETLGPVGPGSSVRFLLQGAAWYSAIQH